MIAGTVLNGGAARGPVVALDAPLSFWGGFDPGTGEVIDRHHPQSGRSLAGCVLLMRESRGSATAPGALAEAIRLGTAPRAIILIAADVNLAIGAAVANTLYGRQCPIVTVEEADFARLREASTISIAPGGSIDVDT